MLTKNENAALKTVDARLFRGRQTERQTDRHTDMTDFMIVAHPQMGNYN